MKFFIIAISLTINLSSFSQINKIIDLKVLKQIDEKYFDQNQKNDKIISAYNLLYKDKINVFVFTREYEKCKSCEDFEDETAQLSAIVYEEEVIIDIISSVPKWCAKGSCCPSADGSKYLFYNYYVDEDYVYSKKMAVTAFPSMLFADGSGKILKRISATEKNSYPINEFRDTLRRLLKELEIKEPSNKAITNTAFNKLEINSTSNTTDIFIKKGDKIFLKASGEITFGAFACSGNPNGIEGYTTYNKVEGFKHGSLLGKIGDGAYFLVGTYKTFTAQGSGKLQLIVNDADPKNNSGSFIVEYSINKEIKQD